MNTPNEPPFPRPFVTLTVAARKLGVPIRWLRERYQAGDIPCIQTGKNIMFHLADTEDAIIRLAKDGAAKIKEQARANQPHDAIELGVHLGLSIRARKCMVRLGIHTIEKLCATTERELMSAPNFGMTTLREIKQALAARGLSLSDRDQVLAPPPPKSLP